MLKCVPLDPAWVGSETKLDLKAIYRRRKQNNWGVPILDADGVEQWDTTTPLPLRRHAAWLAKGFEYITLADFDSLQQVAGYLGPRWHDYTQDDRSRSPFSLEKYLSGMVQHKADALTKLRALVAKHGLDAVTDMKRAESPDWQMPAVIVQEFAEPETDADLGDDPAPKRRPGRSKKEPVAA